jgi:Protein of unknown function (DUF1488)
MPLTATDIRPSLDENRKAIGVWMRNEDGSPVRVFVTCEALCQSEPSKAPDVYSALEIFDAGRECFEKLASTYYDKNGPDEGTHEDQPFIVLHADDIL